MPSFGMWNSQMVVREGKQASILFQILGKVVFLLLLNKNYTLTKLPN